VGAAIVALLGTLVGYVVVKGRGKRLSAFLERISFSPIMIPSIAFGAIYISLFGVSRGPIPALSGTFTIMILVVIGKQIPYGSRCGISAMFQPSKELEEAGEVLGAGWLKRFRQIIWPLTKTGFSSGFLLVFITTTRTLSLFILLVTSKTQVLTTFIFQNAELGVPQLSYALMTTLVTMTLIIIGIYRLYDRYSKKALVEKGIL
jgi:iron(III) transport system permease protein